MRSLRRKRVSLFPKNQRPRNEKTSVRAKKKPKIERAIQSHPIPFNPAAECSGRKAEKEEEENKKRNNFWKVPKTKRYFLIEINLNCFLEKPLGQTQQDKRLQRGWTHLISFTKAYPSDTFACAYNRYSSPAEDQPVRATRGKYSHAYAQICWQLFRWISINPKCLKTYVRTSLWVPNTDWCSLHDQLRRSCHTV